VTYFAYLDEFGHVGPYVVRTDPKYHRPVKLSAIVNQRRGALWRGHHASPRRLGAGASVCHFADKCASLPGCYNTSGRVLRPERVAMARNSVIDMDTWIDRS